MRNNAAYLPENPIVYIIFPESIHNRASFRIVESEYHTGKPLYKHSEEEGDSDGDEDRHDDGEGFVGVYEVAQTEGIAIMYFDK